MLLYASVMYPYCNNSWQVHLRCFLGAGDLRVQEISL